MPGDIDGYSCSAEFIVSSPSPLDPKATVSPEAIARAVEQHLRRLKGFAAPGSRGTHRVVEAHVYRVAPTLTAIRTAMGLRTPWTKRRAPKGARARRP